MQGLLSAPHWHGLGWHGAFSFLPASTCVLFRLPSSQFPVTELEPQLLSPVVWDQGWTFLPSSRLQSGVDWMICWGL